MERIRVLLVDDHPVVRSGTREVLERERDMLVVGEAGDGEEALSLALGLQPDVVLMDISMPRLNGLEATRRIRECLPATAILIFTAYDDDQYISALLEAGASGYLLKNVRSKDLQNAVRAVHHGEAVLGPEVAKKVFQGFGSAREKVSPTDHDALSRREMEVLSLAAEGLGNKEIAERLFLSPRTVQGHMARVFEKMSVGSRTEAVMEALKLGWITLDRKGAGRDGA